MPQNRLLLLTAFEPFGGRAKNASQEALKRLMTKAADFPGLRLTVRFLPVETGAAAQAICRALDEVRPDILLSLGEAKRDAISLEQVGYNERRYTIPDNAGNLLDGAPVVPGGPPAYRSTLPLEGSLPLCRPPKSPFGCLTIPVVTCATRCCTARCTMSPRRTRQRWWRLCTFRICRRLPTRLAIQACLRTRFRKRSQLR